MHSFKFKGYIGPPALPITTMSWRDILIDLVKGICFGLFCILFPKVVSFLFTYVSKEEVGVWNQETVAGIKVFTWLGWAVIIGQIAFTLSFLGNKLERTWTLYYTDAEIYGITPEEKRRWDIALSLGNEGIQIKYSDLQYEEEYDSRYVINKNPLFLSLG